MLSLKLSWYTFMYIQINWIYDITLEKLVTAENHGAATIDKISITKTQIEHIQ